MKLSKLLHKWRWLLIVLSALLITAQLIIFSFLSRGIWRSHILPTYALLRHKNTLEATHATEATKINEALAPLGLNVGTGKTKATCGLDIAVTWHTSIGCSSADSRGTPKVFTPLPGVNDPAIKQTEASLENNGWQGGWDESGYTLLSYDKDINGFSCTLQLWISEEQSVTPRLNCYQGYYYLGNPYKHL